MLKTLIAFNQGNIFEEVAHQELWDPDEKYCLFSVSNLWECPEDAIIGRDLFDSYDAEILIEHGMKWARKLFKRMETCTRRSRERITDTLID